MNLYAASPSDQHLWLGDVELIDKDKMLMQLDITPRCILVLKVSTVITLIPQLTNKYIGLARSKGS